MNGRPLLPTQSTPSDVAPPGGNAARRVKATVVEGRPADQRIPAPKAGAPPLSDPIKQTSATVGSGKIAAKHPRPGNEAKLAVLPRSGRSRLRTPGRRPGATQAVAAVRATYTARVAEQPPSRLGQSREPLASLTPLAPSLKSALAASRALPTVQVPAGVPSVPGRNSLAGLSPAADSATLKLFARPGLLRRGYLHGEAWGSESLPLNAAVKLGVSRLYLVLGAAAEPFGRQSDWAWGVGAGTAGRPRGRFTPSVDLMQWFLSGNRGLNKSRLTQLRPALAWQFKPGGRWQLVGGPTLNLATARREPGRSRWQLGQDQWLWLNSDKGQSVLRLWPGVQLGLRF